MQAIRSDAQEAGRQQQLVLDAIRGAEMRAYAVEGTVLLGGLLDFPVPAHGPSFVWIGYWTSANARRARAKPLLRIGTAPKDDRVNLHSRLQIRSYGDREALSRHVRLDTPFGVQERRLTLAKSGESFVDFEDDDTAVTIVIADVNAAPANITVTRWMDQDALIQEWVSLFG